MSEVAQAMSLFMNDTELLGSITSFEDAIAVLKDAGIELHSTKEYGDGFELLKEKSKLVDVPFVILSMKFVDEDKSDFGDGFVILHVVTKDGTKLIVTDGSSGICKQARLYAAKGITSGLVCEAGLIRSDYDVDIPDKKTGEMVSTPATTYYLS